MTYDLDSVDEGTPEYNEKKQEWEEKLKDKPLSSDDVFRERFEEHLQGWILNFPNNDIRKADLVKWIFFLFMDFVLLFCSVSIFCTDFCFNYKCLQIFFPVFKDNHFTVLVIDKKRRKIHNIDNRTDQKEFNRYTVTSNTLEVFDGIIPFVCVFLCLVVVLLFSFLYFLFLF